MAANAIAIFTPITTRCLEVVAAYLDELHEPTTIYALAGKRLIQSIEPFAQEKAITLEVVSANDRDRVDWQNTIQYMVYQAQKLVFFIPPGVRVIHRKTADKQQGWASRCAVELCRPIERIYVEDTPTAHGKYYRLPAAPTAIQLHLPMFDQFPKPALPPTLPPIRPNTEIPYLSPPRLNVPRWWKKNQLPTQSKRWIDSNVFQPIEQALQADGYHVLTHAVDKTQPLMTARVMAERDGVFVTAHFALPDRMGTMLVTLRKQQSEGSRLMLCIHKPLSSDEHPKLRDQEEIAVIPFPAPLLSIIQEYEDWLNFPTQYSINGDRYYHPGQYTTSAGPSKQWELKHMHPIITAQFEAQKLPYTRQVPLGNYYADFIINAEKYTEIIECKRHPFQHNLRDGVEQLLLYKELYRRLFPTRARREIKLALVLPEGTLSPRVLETASAHGIEIRPLACDPIQTDMIIKKHLAARVGKISRQILAALLPAGTHPPSALPF